MDCCQINGLGRWSIPPLSPRLARIIVPDFGLISVLIFDHQGIII